MPGMPECPASIEKVPWASTPSWYLPRSAAMNSLGKSPCPQVPPPSVLVAAPDLVDGDCDGLQNFIARVGHLRYASPSWWPPQSLCPSSECVKIWSEDCFPTAVEAQADALRYIRDWEANEEERHQEQLANERYGSYEAQTRACHRAL